MLPYQGKLATAKKSNENRIRCQTYKGNSSCCVCTNRAFLSVYVWQPSWAPAKDPTIVQPETLNNKHVTLRSACMFENPSVCHGTRVWDIPQRSQRHGFCKSSETNAKRYYMNTSIHTWIHTYSVFDRRINIDSNLYGIYAIVIYGTDTYAYGSWCATTLCGTRSAVW